MRRTVFFLLAVILALGVGFAAGRAEGIRESGHTVVTLEVLPTPTSVPALAAAAAVHPTPRPSPTPTPAVDYVLNTNTKKFHYPDCPSVHQMYESNAEYYSGSRSELIDRGFKPCQRCKP